MDQRPEGFQTVTRALSAAGHPHAPVFLDAAVRTSQEAADALGIAVGQIAKSVIFRRKSDERRCWSSPRATSASTRRRSPRWSARWAAPMPTSSRRKTGFSIGGVAPVAHATPPVTLIDRELFRFEEIWAAAGHPNGVFKLRRSSWRR